MLVAIMLYVSDIPFLSQPHYHCLWHSVSVSTTLSLSLTFRFCFNHLISVSDIPFLSQSAYLSLSLSDIPFFSLSHSPCTVYKSRSFSFFLNYLSLSLITSFLANTLYRDSKVSSIVSFFHFILFCLTLHALTVVAEFLQGRRRTDAEYKCDKVRWGNMGQCLLLVNIWKFG
jgi:hypothetical protein